MEETSINIQFLKKFFKGLVPNLKELSAHITLAFLTLMYQKNQGRLSIQAWKENVWEAATPWIWLLCGLTLYHVGKAARSVAREIRTGLFQSRKPFIILTDGEQTRVTPNYQLQLTLIVVACALFLSAISYFSWHWGLRTADSSAFGVSDGSLSFINMSQNLATKGSGPWWVTYKSFAGDTASPVALTQYVEITNNLSTPETIRTYSVAIQTEECGWTYLSPIYARDVAAWWTFDGLDSAIQTDFRTNGLDYLLQNPIPAYGTVVGWWFFDSKVQCAVPLGSKVRFRISLTTFSDIKFEYTTAEIIVSNKSHGPGSTEGETMGPQFVVPPNAKADISKYYRRLWSSPIPTS